MISEVIEILKTYTDGKDNTDKVEISVIQLNRIIKELEQQPTDAVDRVTIKEYLSSFEVPQQKMGHWILTDDDFVYCSECEDSYYPRPIDASWYYCPHCGAKMV